MTTTIARPLTKNLGVSLFARLAPAVLAIGIGWGGYGAQATPLDGQNALNAKLIEIYKDFATDPEPNIYTAGDLAHPNQVYDPDGAGPLGNRTSLFKPKTTLDTDVATLTLAVAAVLEDPANSALPTEDVVAGALRDANGKARADRNTIMASIVAQAIKSRNIAGDSNAIAAIVQTVLDTNFTSTTLGLSSDGRAAVIGQALKSATNPAAGGVIANQTRVASIYNGFPAATKVADSQKFTAKLILNAAGTNAVPGNSGAVASFVNQLFSGTFPNVLSPSDRINNAIAIAKLVKASNAAVGATIGGALLGRTDASDVQSDTISALAKTQALQAAATDITAAAAARVRAITNDPQAVVNLATALGASGAVAADFKVKGNIAGGAMQAIFNEDAASIAAIYNALKPVAATGTTPAATLANQKTAATNEITYASLAAIGNSNEKVGSITSQALTNTILDTAGKPILDPTKLGTTIITAISLTNPDGAKNVGLAIASLTGPAAFTVADKDLLALNLAKSAKSAQAAGAAVAGVVTNLPETGATNSKTSAAIKANAGVTAYVSNITMQVGAQFVEAFTTPGATYKLNTFARTLAAKNTAKASDIAVGASMANPILADQVVDKVVFLTGTVSGPNNTPTTTDPSVAGKTKASVSAVVQAVATAVDVEEAAEIATQVASHFTIDGKAAAVGITNGDLALAVSNAPTLATAVATAIQNKPGVKTANRQDELGEVAASLVGQLINEFVSGQLKYGTATTTRFAQVTSFAAALSSVTTNIIKTLSTTELVDNVKNDVITTDVHKGVTLKADLSAAANIAGDVANTVFQAISALGLSNSGVVAGQPTGQTKTEFQIIRDKLLADIPKLGGKSYGDSGTTASPIAGVIRLAMNDGFAGNNTKYEDGTQNAANNPSDPAANPTTLPTGTKTGSVIDPETDTRPG